MAFKTKLTKLSELFKVVWDISIGINVDKHDNQNTFTGLEFLKNYWKGKNV